MSEKWNKIEIPYVPENWNGNKENDFNDWLAKHLNCLRDLLKIDSNIELVERESRNDNNKRLDILASYCMDEDTKEYIAIESQVTESNYDHFGRLLMYMATIDKKPTIGVWIVQDITPDVKETIKWINDRLTNCDLYVLKPLTIKIDTTECSTIGIDTVQGVHFEVLVKPDIIEKAQNIEENRKRRENFKFFKLGIDKGAELIYIEDENIKCTVASGINKVIYKDKEYTLSGLTNELKGNPSNYGILPLEHWLYKDDSGEGQKLSVIRSEKDRN